MKNRELQLLTYFIQPSLIIHTRHSNFLYTVLTFIYTLTSVNAKYYYQYTLILHRHYHLINIYTGLAPKLSATASVAQW